MNEMNTMEIWNLDLPALPERSHLYHLEPLEVGSPYVESLTSYITRLAEAHSVSPKELVIYSLFPLLDRPTLSAQSPNKHSLWMRNAKALNGMSEYARDWVRALERLTLRSDLSFLTMMTWNGVIGQRRLLRATQAWCPGCYAEWRRNNSSLYNPLLWSLKAVSECPRHSVPLSTHCSNEDCLQLLPLLSIHSRIGYCPYCMCQLGIDPVSLNVNNEKKAYCDDLEHQHWIANAIGELIEAAPSLPALPHPEKLATSITQCANQLAEGSLKLLGRRLGLAHGAILAWQRQDTLPRLEMLLRLCSRLGISPRLLLIETIEDYSKISSIKPAKRSKRKPIGDDELRRILEACLIEEPPPSLKEVATRLSYCQESCLYGRFSKLSCAIQARFRNENMSRRPKAAKARTRLALDELRKYLQEVLMSDETPLPSILEIAKRLGYSSGSPFYPRVPDLCAAIVKKRREQLKNTPLRQALEAALASDEYPPPSLREIAKRLSCTVERLYNNYPQICHALVKRHNSVFDTDSIQKELEAAFGDTSLPPPTVRDVAQRVGFGEARLRRHFPELCSQISVRYQIYRKNRGIARRQHIRDEVKRAIIQLSVEGCYPSLSKVRQLLQGEKSAFADVSRAWQELLREMHIEKDE